MAVFPIEFSEGNLQQCKRCNFLELPTLFPLLIFSQQEIPDGVFV